MAKSGESRLQGILPWSFIGDRSRYLVLLGRQNGDDVIRIDGSAAFQDSILAPYGQGRKWSQDV